MTQAEAKVAWQEAVALAQQTWRARVDLAAIDPAVPLGLAERVLAVEQFHQEQKEGDDDAL